MADTGFAGFPRACVTFLDELRIHNDRAWFEAHRDEYERFLVAPARDFVVALGRRLATLSPGVNADPRIDRSIFRLNRDTRFARDAAPYKTHLGVWLWEGVRARMECSGYYFHLEPPSLMLGVGLYLFPKDLLPPYREALVDPRRGPALAAALAELRAAGPYDVGGAHLKRVPSGFDPQHPNAALLKHNGLWVGAEGAIPDELYRAELVDWCFERYRTLKPVHDWLVEVLSGIAGGGV